MKLLGSYLREHLKNICMYAGFVGIFAVIFFLCSIQLDAVLYAFLLSAVWMLCYGTGGYITYVGRHRKLLEAEKKITAEWAEFPEPADILEEDYQRMLKNLFERRLELESEEGIARQELMDYYSLWAHQIKTPIAAMRVLLQSLEQDSEDYKYRKELKLELFKIEQYVEMVLSYLRLGEMSSDLVLQWYSLDDVIRQAIRKYSQMFILQKIKLEYEPVEEMVLSDEKWLVFVLEQLLSNALKYTKSGNISIYMEVKSSAKVLVIADTGIGIQEEDIPRVFEKGFTGYNGRKDKKSTGIGLYLCKSVLDKLGHGICIESSVGSGTKVNLSLERKEITPE